MIGKRREFPKPIKAEIVRRAKGADGQLRCEECHAVITGKEGVGFQIDHTIPEGLVVDKSKKLTAKDGQLLCSGKPTCCHDLKTNKEDKPGISRAVRREAKDMGLRPTAPVKKIESAPFPISEKTAKAQTSGKLPLPPRVGGIRFVDK